MELQKTIEQALRNVPRMVLEKRLREKIAKAGAVASPKAVRDAAERILAGAAESFSFRMEVTGNARASIEITAEDLNHVAEASDRFLEVQLDGVLRKIAEDSATAMLKKLKKGWPAEAAAQRSDITAFKKRLEGRWGKSLDKLRMLVTIAREWAEAVIARKATQGKLSHLDDVVLRLYIRACQIANEIVLLLENGYADGAMARWRTLHEVATVCAVVAHFGEDIAERYVLFQIVEGHRALNSYERCHATLGYKPAPKRRVTKVRSDYADILKRFGKPFGKDYGWAASHLNKDRVTFAMLEEVADAAHMRSHYKMASYNVHASPKGIYYKLGQLDGSTNVFLAGPSNAGLFEPAQNAAVTLTRMSMLICGGNWLLDDLVTGRIMSLLMFKIPDELRKADAKLRRDDRRYRGANAPPAGRSRKS
jgi:hypothetical protein